MNCSLREQGHEVAVDRALPGEPSPIGNESWPLILLDLRCGQELVATFAKRTPYLVALDEDDGGPSVLRAMRYGARDFLPLPLTPETLEEALARWESFRHEEVASLEYRDEDGRLRIFPLREKLEVGLGRDPDNDICFASQVISRFHARITPSEGSFVVEDRESRHGIFVNDQKIAGSARLRDGDRIRLGKPSAPMLTFRLAGSSERTADGGTDVQDTGVAPSPNRELKEVAAILDTFLTLNRDLVLEDVLSLVLTRSIEFAESERGMILLKDEVGGKSFDASSSGIHVQAGSQHRLHLAMARNRDGTPMDAAELAISQKIPEKVLTTGKGVILEDLLTEEEAHLHMNTIDLGVRSAMCVPLRARLPGEDGTEERALIGVLYVDSRSRARPFSDTLLHALESLANEAAQAIVNAHLYEVSLEKRRIDEEMQIAQSIQENLLPPEEYENSWVALRGSSHPSRQVGGDIINYYPAEDRLIGILVGDVSGKGIAAAIFSAMLDGHFLSLSTVADPGSDLSRWANELNAYLVNKSQGQKFVSLLFGVLHEDGAFEYVNAGHNPPLHVASSGDVSLLTTGGMIMGLFEEADYEKGRLVLDPGDSLVLYSDGITEARSPARDLFGLERLKEIAVEHRHRSASDIHEEILSNVRRFTEGSPPTDDITIMVVRRKAAGP